MSKSNAETQLAETIDQEIPPLTGEPTSEEDALVARGVEVARSRALPEGAIVDFSKVGSFRESQDAIRKLETLFQSKVVLLHIASGSHLTGAEISELYNHLHLIGPQEKLTAIIQGSGGSIIAAYRIAKLLRHFAKSLTIAVPREAFSALTMLALAGDNILVSPLSVFSPTDSSISGHPLAPLDPQGNPVSVEITQLKKYLELVGADRYSELEDFTKTPFSVLSDKVHPIFLGTIQRSLSLSKQVMRNIMSLHQSDAALIERVVNTLNDVYPSHTFPIFPDDLRKLGMTLDDLTEQQNRELLDLLHLSEHFATGRTDANGDRRIKHRRSTIIESRDLRSFYAFEIEERLTGDTWEKKGSRSEYRRASVVKTKRGYYEARTLTALEFRKLLVGQEIEVE